ncbi:MAG: glycerol kinase GlpK [Pseudomonadota bacterium]
MTSVLAIDQGTTSSRAIIYDAALNTLGVGQHPFEQHYPKPGWVEHDPEEIWQTTLRAIEDALRAAGIGGQQLAAIGITNQRETVVAWHKDSGKSFGNAIVWQDRRTSPICQQLKSQGLEPTVTEKTGLVLDPYFSASKIQWILENNTDARQAANEDKLLVGTIDSWLVWKLTAGNDHLIEASNASRTLLLNLNAVDWDDELLSIFSIPRSVLPTIVDSSGEIAEARIAPLQGVAITGVAGDQQAALFGQTCFNPGEAKCTYGTGCFLLTNVGTKPVPSNSRLLSTLAWKIGANVNYALEGSVFIGGALIQWLRDNLGIVENAAEIETLAASVADNGGVTLVPAFAGLGAPHWDAEARGTLLGITRGTTTAHIARAALEGMALQVADVIEAMRTDLSGELTTMRVDGGACVNNLLMQIQGDYSGLHIQRATNLESTALGAATLAGLGAGIWSSADALLGLWQAERTFSPSIEKEALTKVQSNWRRAIARAGAWAED